MSLEELGKRCPLTPGKQINLPTGEDSMNMRNVSSTHLSSDFDR